MPKRILRIFILGFLLLSPISIIRSDTVFASNTILIPDTLLTSDTILPEDAMLAEQNVSENNAPLMDADLGLSAPSYILMEPSTGKVILEKNADEVLRPASITKIMTMILIFDALKEGKITLSEEVTVSEYAASMGGSQVFLETGEKQTVDTLLKCIAVASANDACVAMAEKICGSETEFVNQMNARAKALGMEHTFFMNCNGLDTDGHVTTARDVAVMSKELITKYPKVHDYSTIWMEDITHVTEKGSFPFGLANTNKLIRQYEYATGLKTGSTSLAKFCVSATAKKNNIEMIAVIMAAPDPKIRFHDATALLEYGYSISKIYEDKNKDTVSGQRIAGGIRDSAEIIYAGPFSYLSVTGENFEHITKEIRMEEMVKAPVTKNEKAGEAVYLLDGKRIGSVDLLYKDSIRKAEYRDCLIKTFRYYLQQTEKM